MPAKFFLPLLLFFLFSCQQKQDKNLTADSFSNQVETSAEPPQTISTDSIGEILPEIPLPEIISWEKKLIKNATLTVEVEDFKNFNTGLHTLVTQYSGYISSERNSYADYRNESVVTIKVPTIRFEELLNQLNNKGIKTIERNISTQDVTSEMKDNKARLETKKETHLKYLEFLKKSKNINEVLKVQKEINALQEEIDLVNGRQIQLTHETTFSTIQLTFFTVTKDNSSQHENPGFANRFILAISSGISVIGEFLILLAKLWPFIFIGIAAYFVFKRKKVFKI